MAVYGDLMFQNMDGPGHQEAAERAKAMLAPPVQQLLSGQTPPDPKMVQQQQLAQKVIDELTAHVTELTRQIESKQVENDAKKEIAAGQAAIDVLRIKVDALKAIAVAEIGAKSKTDIAQMDQAISAVDAIVGMEKEARLEAHNAAHERGTQAADHIHALVTQHLEQQHERDLSDQTHEQTKEITAMQPSTNGA
jgi:hypothetical protein